MRPIRLTFPSRVPPLALYATCILARVRGVDCCCDAVVVDRIALLEPARPGTTTKAEQEQNFLLSTSCAVVLGYNLHRLIVHFKHARCRPSAPTSNSQWIDTQQVMP